MAEGKRVGQYTLISKIGKGGQATVWKGNDEQGQLVAIKKMSVGSDEDNTKSYEREVAIMKLVNHKYLVKSIDSFKEGKNYYLVYEYCPTDLLSFLQKQPGNRFRENVAKRWIFELINVMAHLNKHRIIHRDLKPDNILLTTTDENAEIRLADFGLARQGLTTRSFVGTLEYASPEIKNCQDYSYNTDVYSLGVILFALLFGKLPIFRGPVLTFPESVKDVSDESKRFIEKCLTFDKMQRPDFDSLLQDQYFEYFNEEPNEAQNPEISIINHINRMSIRPMSSSSIVHQRSEHIQRPEEENKDIKINDDEIIHNPSGQLFLSPASLPTDKKSIEELIFRIFFLARDVMDFVNDQVSRRQDLSFMNYFAAQYFTDQFRFVLDNLMNSPIIINFGFEFFENFFQQSEKITNICANLEGEYKNLSPDHYIALSFQIEEVIASCRENSQSHVLALFQEISQNMRQKR
jgi:serine/threonine protein kinase